MAQAPTDWIIHDGGPCPLPMGARAETRARDGHVSINEVEDTKYLWIHGEFYPQWDIIAYRVVPA